jgi:hypothetical protein
MARTVHRNHDRMRLDVALVRQAGSESVFKNQIRFFESRIDVAGAPVLHRKYIGKTFNRRLESLVGGKLIMDERRAGFHRLARIENGWQLFVFNLDKCERFFRRVAVFSRERHYLFPGKTHLSVREQRRILQAQTDPVRRQILCAQHRDNTAHVFRFRRIDADDARMRVRAAQAFAP